MNESNPIELRCKKILSRIKGKDILYIYGKGVRGNIFKEWILLEVGTSEDLNIVFIDKDCTEDKSSCISFDEFKTKDIKDEIVFISSTIYRREMMKNLLSINVKEENILFEETEAFWIYISNLINEKYVRKSTLMLDDSFKNCESGKRAFIIGNGPSLSTDDLEKIENEVTFATNEIFYSFNQTDWRPTYYVVADKICTKLHFSTLEKVENMLENCKYFICNTGTCVFQNAWDKKYKNLRFYEYKMKRDSDVEELYKFSNNPTEGVGLSGTSLFDSYQMAMYFGVKEIYLIGMDFSFAKEADDEGNIIKQSNENDHAAFIELDDADPAIYNTKRILQAHMDAKRYADSHGIKIYNATRGGKLEVFERVDFDSLFEEK